MTSDSSNNNNNNTNMMDIDDMPKMALEMEEVHDILEVMRRKESGVYRLKLDADELVALWRRLLIEWMYYVVDYCQLQRRSVAAAAFFLDVAMSRGLIRTREEHQLAAATALQLSLKTVDTSVIKLDKLVKLGRGLFNEDDVVRMERQILESLNWHLHPPTTYCFLKQYERLLPTSMSDVTRQMIDEVTKLVTELTVAEHQYTRHCPSVIAFAAILLAMELVDHVDLPVHQRQCFVLRMSTYAKMESSSDNVLRVFEELKKTLDGSSKLQKLIESLSKSFPRTMSKTVSPDARNSRDKSIPSSGQSPRHVMDRFSVSS